VIYSIQNPRFYSSGAKKKMFYSAGENPPCFTVRDTVFYSAVEKIKVFQCRCKDPMFSLWVSGLSVFQYEFKDSVFYSRGVKTPWFTVFYSVFYSAGVRTLV
jgi:hypothetical protein